MSDSVSRITSFNSVLSIILKEIRLEKGMHQAVLADAFGKTPSAIAKMESGKTPLTMEMLMRYWYSLNVPPSALVVTMEQYATVLAQNGWSVVGSPVDSSEDLLLALASEFWKKAVPKEFYSRPMGSILNTPNYAANGQVNLAGVFQYVLSSEYREWLSTFDGRLGANNW